ncbi:hypothetical protein VTK26DRAFT_5223 [Humicola hyalothermophila]
MYLAGRTLIPCRSVPGDPRHDKNKCLYFCIRLYISSFFLFPTRLPLTPGNPENTTQPKKSYGYHANIKRCPYMHNESSEQNRRIAFSHAIKQPSSLVIVVILPILLHLIPHLIAAAAAAVLLPRLQPRLARLQLGHLARGGAPVGQQVDAELAHADAKQLEQARLPRVERLAGAADGVALALHRPAGVGVPAAQAHLAPDHARRHPQAPQLGLERVRHRHVVLGGHLAARRVDDPRRHRDGARRDAAGARKVDVGEGGEVGDDGGRVAVREEEADGAREVAGQVVQAVGLGFFGGRAEGAGGELGFTEEEADVWW